MIGSGDDPLSNPTVWPYDKSREYGGPAPLKLARTEYGGHFEGLVDETNEGENMAAKELARFIDHVDRQSPYTPGLLPL